MQLEAFNLYNVFTKTAFDATRQLIDINARTYEKLVKRQTELTSDFIESGIKQMVSHYMAAQKELAQEYAEKVQTANKDTVKIVAQAQDEVNRYLEENLPAAINQVRSAAQNVTKETAETPRSTANKKAA
jgi:hypothetical protein